MKRTGRFVLTTAMLAATAGCYILAESRPAVSHLPFGPPALRAERKHAPPGPEVAWNPGHWRWEGQEYVWLHGTWMPHTGRSSAWVPGEWGHDDKGWYWIEGHWS